MGRKGAQRPVFCKAYVGCVRMRASKDDKNPSGITLFYRYDMTKNFWLPESFLDWGDMKGWWLLFSPPNHKYRKVCSTLCPNMQYLYATETCSLNDEAAITEEYVNDNHWFAKKNKTTSHFKEIWHKIFDFDFFHESVSPVSVFKFFRKFAEIFANLSLSLSVSCSRCYLYYRCQLFTPCLEFSWNNCNNQIRLTTHQREQ